MVTELQHHVSLDSGPCASDRVQVVPVLWFRGEAEGDGDIGASAAGGRRAPLRPRGG